MATPRIVEAIDLLEESQFGIAAGRPGLAPDEFGLKGLEEATFDGKA